MPEIKYFKEGIYFFMVKAESLEAAYKKIKIICHERDFKKIPLISNVTEIFKPDEKPTYER